MEKTKLILIGAYVLWNLIVFIVYGIDKYKAKHDKWRIPEKTLLLLAFLMGGLGAYLGMKVFRHKTQHKLFIIGVPLCIVLNILFLVLPGILKWKFKLSILKSL